MITTMEQYYKLLSALDKRFPAIALLEVLELRIRRLEAQAGIPMPEDLESIRKLYGKEK